MSAEGEEVEIWGDGLQTRSFMYVDDCVEGLLRIMASDCADPLNLGTDQLVTINELFDMVCHAAGKKLRRVNNKNRRGGFGAVYSDNDKLRRTLGWEPGSYARTGSPHHVSLD